MNRPTIAILASGAGSTSDALIRASASGKIEPEVALVITNNPSAGILERVEKINDEYGTNIDSVVIGRKDYPIGPNEKLNPGDQTVAEEAAILDLLKKGDFDLILLGGYLKKIGPNLVREFGWRPDYTSPYQARMLNTHPGLLPDTKGLYGIHTQEHVIKNGLSRTGHTVHVVAEDYDDGPIIAEHKVEVYDNENPEVLFERIKALQRVDLTDYINDFVDERVKYSKKTRRTK